MHAKSTRGLEEFFGTVKGIRQETLIVVRVRYSRLNPDSFIRNNRTGFRTQGRRRAEIVERVSEWAPWKEENKIVSMRHLLNNKQFFKKT